MHALAIPGSLRPGSYNRRLVELACRLAPAGLEVRVWDGLCRIPHYGEHLDGDRAPRPVVALRAAIRDAGALLVATPEYNGSLPGSLKNVLDWASRPYGRSALTGKPVAVIGASTGPFGAVWAQADARRILGISGARVLDGELAIGSAADAFGDGGMLRDRNLTARLVALLCGLATAARDRDLARAA